MRTKRRNRVIFVSSLVASLSVAFIFIVLAMNENVDFYYTPSDLTSSKIINKDSLRIGGLVQEDSIKISKDSLKTNFLVTDLENSIEVYYEGILPNLFKENSGVIAPYGGSLVNLMVPRDKQKALKEGITKKLECFSEIQASPND